MIQCFISSISVLYCSRLQGLYLPQDIELHITYSSIPSSCFPKTTKRCWEHKKLNNEITKWKNIYKKDKLVKTTSTRLATFNASELSSSIVQKELFHLIAHNILNVYERSLC